MSSPACNIILIKHSLPEFTPGLPANRWTLSDEGRQRCKPLAEQVAAYQPQVIFSSLEPKAQETARLMGQFLALGFAPYPNLHEHLRESAVFTCQDEFQAAVERFFTYPADLVYGEETADQAHQRFSGAVNTLLEQHTGQNLVIVAHGTVISLFVSRLFNIEPFPLWKRLGLPSFVVLSLPDLALVKVIEEIPANP